MIQLSNRVNSIMKIQKNHTVEIFEANKWWQCSITPKSLEEALEFASDRAKEIGEERVRILLDGKPIV
jgi:hypothetical protein